jgi:hypothetical protein
MATKTEHFTIPQDRELSEDEFWTEREKLRTEGWELVGTFGCTETEKLRCDSQARKLEDQGFALRTLRKAESIQILKKKLEQIPEEAEIQEDTREEVRRLTLVKPKTARDTQDELAGAA